MLQKMRTGFRLAIDLCRCARIQKKYRDYTMIPRHVYVSNLLTAMLHSEIAGCVVECGVWRGGMSAGLAEVLGPDRTYYLFDSFEGLPPPRELDGERAKSEWQARSVTPEGFCKANESYAAAAMRMSPAKRFHLVKGWFNDIVPNFEFDTPIAVVRLDGDWYESTLVCLEHLYHKVVPGGLVILDDYYCWDGCAKAVHHFLAERQLPARVDRCFGYTCIMRPFNTGRYYWNMHPLNRFFTYGTYRNFLVEETKWLTANSVGPAAVMPGVPGSKGG